MSGRRSRSRERLTSLRPRPVTATVTKPKWMQPEAIVGPRSQSLESRGSTASLTSVLEHDSYISISDEEVEYHEERRRPKSNPPRRSNHGNKENVPTKTQDDVNNYTFNVKPKKPMNKKKVIRKFVEPSVTDDTETESPEPDMSPWEQWLIEKVKHDREKKKEEKRKKREEKMKKEQEAAIKQKKEQKAEEVRQEWLEKKKFEEQLKRKVDKRREKTEKMIAEEKKKMEQVKADRKFEEWKEDKREKEKERKRQEKLKKLEEERLQKEQKIKAQQKFEEWCRKADHRPKQLPNSFGYTSGKLTGYHDSSAYPVPTFYNPMPWQPIHIPRPASEKRKRQNKPRPKRAWNPEKYR